MRCAGKFTLGLGIVHAVRVDDRLDLRVSCHKVSRMSGLEGVFPGKVGIQHGTVSTYRAPLFDELARVCQGGVSVFAGHPRPNEGIATTDKLAVARLARARNRNLFDGTLYLCWQHGLIRWLEEWDPDV